MKSRKLSCSSDGETRCAYQILVAKAPGKRSLQWPIRIRTQKTNYEEMFKGSEVDVTGSESWPTLGSGIRGVEAAGSSRSTETCSSKTRTHSAFDTSVTNLSPYFKQQIYCPSRLIWRALQRNTQGNNKFPQATGIQYLILMHKVCWIRTSLFIHYTDSFENSEDSIKQACALKVCI